MKNAAPLASIVRAATPSHTGRWRLAWSAGLLTAVLALLGPPARGQTPPPAVFTTLYAFSALDANYENPEGGNPVAAPLLGVDGNLYGTALYGGANGNGTIFRLTPGGTVSALHTFSALDGSFDNADGTNPAATLIQDSAGNLYGTARQGGADDEGTIFELTLAGGFSDLHNFGSEANEADGALPRAGLVLTPDGFIAGAAANGGDAHGDGTLIFIDQSGNLVSVLDLGGSPGAEPVGSLALDRDGILYGACVAGGNVSGNQFDTGSGTIFGEANDVSSDGAFLVYAFSALDGREENPDGANPNGGVIVGRDNNLYGTTFGGGPAGAGTVWQFVVDRANGGGTLNVLHAFNGTDGFECQTPLLQGSDGSFYGTVVNSGNDAGTGVVFRVTTGKVFTILHAFSATDNNGANTDGVHPAGGLVEVRPGSFVGTASGGGAHGSGTIYEVDVPPVITSAATSKGNAGSAFSYQITAVDGPVSYSVGGLGDGLTFNATSGLIAGTPTVAGTLNLTINATNGAGTGSQPLTVTITALPVITSAATASAVQGQAFSYRITATNSPTKFAAANLPGGLTINASTGLITGTPVSAGSVDVTTSATNGMGTGSANLVLTIVVKAPVITSATTATATQGVAFSYQITASDDPTSYAAAGLPAGLTLKTSTGLITGTPESMGTAGVKISAINSAGTGSATLTIAIREGAPVITSATTARDTAGTAFSYQIAANNHPTSFAATGLPSGLTVNSSTGLITGRPINVGTAVVTISATNPTGTGTARLTITVQEDAPVITSATGATLDEGQAFSYKITATNSPTSFAATGLPSGLSINTTTGVISGTLGDSGVFTVSISARNATGTGTATLDINGHPSFFKGEDALSNGVYYLAFASGRYFGYYGYLTDANYIYHFDLGYEYVFDAKDGKSGVYFYDFKSSDFFYTSPGLPFPYLYDFGLKSVLYYYPDPSNAGHYNTDGVRYFYEFSTGKIISK